MRILVLSSLVKTDDVRDSVTYNFITRELEALASAGHDVYFYINREKLPRVCTGFTYVNQPRSIKRHLVMLMILTRFARRFIPGMFLELRRTMQILKTEASVSILLRTLSIDVIHTHFLSPGGESCVLAASLSGIPVVATLRGAELRDLPELDYGSMRSKCFRYMFEWSKLKVSCFTAPNAELVELLESEHGIAEADVELVLNGVPSLPDYEHSFAQPKIKIIAVGWFTKLKNQQLLLEALVDLDPRRYEVSLIGEGPLAEVFEEFVRENNLTEIKFETTIERNELLKRIAGSDVLVHCSLIEGMPNVVLESLALGTPVAASRISAHETIITHGYNGFLFDKCESQELKLLLQELIGNTGRLDRIRVNSRSSSASFSLAKKIDRYVDIYHRVIS